MVVTSDGRRVVSASGDQAFKVWDLETSAKERTFPGHKDRVRAVAVTPNGLRVVSASDDWTLKLWDLKTETVVRTFHGHTGGVNAVAVTPDGRRVVSASWDRTLKLWDLGTGRTLVTYTADAEVTCCAIALDGITLVAGDQLGRVHFLRLEE